jgi:hypothetical protein
MDVVLSRPYRTFPSYHLGGKLDRQPSCKKRHSALVAASLLSHAFCMVR